MISPSNVFNEMKHHKKFGMQMFLIILIELLAFYLISEKALSTNPEVVKMMSGNDNNLFASLIKFVSVALSLIQFIFIIVVSTILYKFCSFVFKIKISFGSIFKINIITQVPIIVGKFINMPFMNDETYNLSITSLGYGAKVLFNLDNNSILLSILSNIEIFSMLSMGLVCLGIHIFSGENMKKCVGVVILSWLVTLVIFILVTIIKN